MAEGKFVAYYRVSTDKQGELGLGMEAQRKAVDTYLNGGGWELIETFTEVESGKRHSNRPVLATAMEHCRKHKATLLIAKLDRLARNVHFISGLIESKLPFVCCDYPQADKMMLQMMAVFAEWERDRISERTKAALSVAKERGVELGKHGKVIAAENKAAAIEFAMTLKPTICALREEGFTSVRNLTDELNRRDVPTAKGGRWHVPTTHNLLKRLTDESVANVCNEQKHNSVLS